MIRGFLYFAALPMTGWGAGAGAGELGLVGCTTGCTTGHRLHICEGCPYACSPFLLLRLGGEWKL